MARAYEAKVDGKVVDDLMACSTNEDKFKAVKGTTMCADDFYEGKSWQYPWKRSRNGVGYVGITI